MLLSSACRTDASHKGSTVALYAATKALVRRPGVAAPGGLVLLHASICTASTAMNFAIRACMYTYIHVLGLVEMATADSLRFYGTTLS